MTTDLLLLDCETCRHRFHVRRSVASMVQVCPKCRHFVVPAERVVQPAVLTTAIAPPEIAPPVPQRVASIVAMVPTVTAPPAPVAWVPRPVQPSPGPFDILGRFLGGFALGIGAIVGFLLLLHVFVWLFCVGAFLFVLARVVAACSNTRTH